MKKTLGILILVTLFLGLLIAQTILYRNGYAISYITALLYTLSIWLIVFMFLLIIIGAICLILY